jgi:hypothetical protein
MSLFETLVIFDVTPAEADILARPIEGAGGHQALLRDLLRGWDPIEHPLIAAEPAALRKAAALAYDYGSGGYQIRFRTILAAARRQGWTE